jgi:hypothetical protein
MAMLLWLVAIGVLLLVLSRLWRTLPTFAGGVLIGLPIAYFFSDDIAPYLTGMSAIPLWLPPLPFAIVALTLLVFGVIVWLRADALPPPPTVDDEHGHAPH